MIQEHQYKECATCKVISDCPHPECDIFGTPRPPEVCMKPWDVQVQTWKENSKERRKKK